MSGRPSFADSEPFDYLTYSMITDVIVEFRSNHLLTFVECKVHRVSTVYAPSLFVRPGPPLKLLYEVDRSCLFGICRLDYVAYSECISEKLRLMSLKETYKMFQVFDMEQGVGVISYLKPILN